MPRPMIDIHTHILPALDDGAGDWDESVEMCRIAREDGITAVVASSHIKDGLYPNTREEIVEKVRELKERLEGDVELDVYPGAEVHIAVDLVERLESGEVPTINDAGYILLELPFDLLPPQTEELLKELKRAKVTPVLAHPERCFWIQREFHRIEGFVEAGALVQITAMSLTGGFGPPAKLKAMELLKKGLAHVIASDAHSSGPRPPVLTFALEAAIAVVGEEEALRMVKETPLGIIRGGL